MEWPLLRTGTGTLTIHLVAGLIAFSGYGGSVFLMGWTGGYVLLALLPGSSA